MASPIRSAALAAIAAAGLILAAGSPAAARAPSAADQGSMDWLLQRLAKDREEENKQGAVVDPVTAFRMGDGPLEGDTGWRVILTIVWVGDKAGKKNDAAAAIVDRFRLEDERRWKIEDETKKAAEMKALWAVKRQVCLATMNSSGMLGSNQVVLGCVYRIQKALLPAEFVNWKETDSLRARKKAYDELVKRLK